MSAREVMHRLRYATTVAAERRRHARGRLAPPDRLRNSLSAPLQRADWRARLLESRRAHRTRFFHSISDTRAMRDILRHEYPHEYADTMRHAAAARAHRFEFFGQVFDYPADINWQADPVTRRPWPAVFHADSRVHGGDVGCGDVKYVWELNRQQFLIDLGKAWCLERQQPDLDALQALVRSWIAGNPYATGVNWACALEPAFRVFSWLWAYYLTVADLDDDLHTAWICSFYDHARFIDRHLELYSSPYNHLIAEAAALYMIGVCFPEFAHAARWRARGRRVLETRLREQFYADGGSVEQSPFYHHATIGFYLLAGILARAVGDELSPAVWNAVERGLNYSVALVQPDGKTPPIGGADDGKPIRLEHLPFWDFRPYQAIGAVLFQRPDFKHVAGRFYEDALWLLGPAGLSSFTALPSHPPTEASISLRASGYYVMRSRWSPDADYVCVDCGEQAAGMRSDAIPNSMHGHADCLSVIAWLQGRRVLVDSGLFSYNCGGSWEAHFRETAAHNTARIDGKDQARHIRKMAWSHSYRASLESWRAETHQARFVGSHDGYARGPNGVVHRRAVWLRPKSYLVICDEFVGRGEHEITVTYQFAPGDLVAAAEDAALFDGAIDVVWAGSEPWHASVACGGSEPGDGWIAPSLGVKQAAPRLRLSCRMTTPRTTLMTVLAARTASTPRVSLSHVGGTTAHVTRDGGIDCIVAAGISPTRPITTNALLAVCHVSRDGAFDSESLDGTVVVVDADELQRLTGMPLRQPAGAS
jgi:hypothetical protein